MVIPAQPARISLGDRRIGPGEYVFVIAEAGVNHNGDVDLALGLVEAAAAAGADAVKFQTFDPARLAADGTALADYQRASLDGEGETQRSMLARLTLSADEHRTLQRHAAAYGLIFLSSPFDEGSADLLESLSVPAFKVASGELTNHPFLRHLALKGRPLLVSTGMSTLEEVSAAATVIRSVGDCPFALLHCVSNYPAAAADANLAAIDTLRDAFAVPTGWSDHTTGSDIAIAAVARGASIIEKHLTLDRTLAGPDHAASLEPDEFAAMSASIRRVEAAIGDGVKRPAPPELPMIAAARKSLHWVRDMGAGSSPRESDLVALRPGTGIPPSELERLLKRRTSRAVRAGSLVTPEDLA